MNKFDKKNKTILIIDDDPQGLDWILNTYGYETDLATDGREGIEKLFAGKTYDLAIVDLVMPNMNGWNVLEEIRSHNKTKTLPVIIITGFNTSNNHINSLHSGADDYIAKPYEINTLLARIESLLRRIDWDNQKTLPELEQVFVTTSKKILTNRQTEILRLMGTGFSNKEIAHKLYLSETTVKAHLRAIFKKLQVTNRTQAVLSGIKNGIIDECELSQIN